ncbi:BRO family protein [Weissella cibaria]|uniref:BRO family protein n=1 Tax=Weissella cibaria TaxID=137591 RepID=UPI0025542141|nr:BRO family protein [Weissella cibaria]MDK9676767.1 BRO family protein [Weissella cibaria]
MTNEVQVFNGLKVKKINGQVMFDAESAAIGLGLTKISKGQQYVRWERVNEYLGLSTSGQLVKRGDFITEPQFYKLAIKANNEIAERFQDWVTTEVLPSIRKTGSYQAQPMTFDEKLALALQSEQDTRQRVGALEGKVDNMIVNQPVNATDYAAIGEAVSNRVHAWSKVHHVPSNKRGPLLKDLNSQIKQVTGAGNRTRIKSSQYDMVINFIDTWQPSTATAMMVQQTELEV